MTANGGDVNESTSGQGDSAAIARRVAVEVAPMVVDAARELQALRVATQVESGSAEVRRVPDMVEVLAGSLPSIPRSALAPLARTALQLTGAIASVGEAASDLPGLPDDWLPTGTDEAGLLALAQLVQSQSPLLGLAIRVTKVVVTARSETGDFYEEREAEVIGPYADRPGQVIAVLRDVDARWLEATVVAVPYQELCFRADWPELGGVSVYEVLARSVHRLQRLALHLAERGGLRE